jgi:hypothetical protein
MPWKAAPHASARHAHVSDAPAPLITTGSQHLSDWPVHFATAATVDITCDTSLCCLYNSNVTRATSMLATFDWASYGFNSRHIFSTIRDRDLPFKVVLACNPFVCSCVLLPELSKCTIIMSSPSAMLDHICSSGFTSKLTGYAIHSYRYLSIEPTLQFWEIQSNIVKQLCLVQSLPIVTAFVHPDHNCNTVSMSFTKRLCADGWVVSETNILNPNFGDSIPGGCRLIIGIYSNTEPDCKALVILTPPSIPAWPLARFIWAPFNMPEHAVSYAKDDKSFNLHAVNNKDAPHLRVSTPTPNQEASTAHGIKLGYYLHRECNNPHVLVGSSVVCLDGLCPAFNPTDNQNLFGHFFGVEFTHDGHEYVCAISQFELTSCLCISDKFTYCLAEPSNLFFLNWAVLGLTSAQIFNQIHKRCIHI